MVPKRIRQLSAVSAGIPGVGFVSPFVMIPVETTRNMWNQAVRGAELLANGVKTGNTKMALAGGKKLALLGVSLMQVIPLLSNKTLISLVLVTKKMPF